LFFRADLKSLVWYSPENFEDAGYDIPESMEELKALTDQIVADGGTPWCIGLGSGAATGWPATDWVEEMMLRELIEYIKTTDAHEIWMSRGAFLTPHKGVDVSKFPDDASRKMNEILTNATTFRFDASDLMPGGVGAGSFWTGMVDYAGGKDATEVAQAIQDSWDALK